ncbi:hypothetical protein EJB05_52401, partial [Eragrostis curvula]
MRDAEPKEEAEAEQLLRSEEEEEDEEEAEEGWDDWCSDDKDVGGGLLCLFCSSCFNAENLLFEHCATEHCFNFHSIVKELELDFYSCIKLINFVRSMVAEKKCWSCGQAFSSNTELCSHLHAVERYLIDGKVPWKDDVYLKPFMEDDSLLHSLSINDDDDEDEDNCGMPMERGQCSAGNGVFAELPGNKLSTISERNGSDISPQFHHEMNDSHLKVARASVNAKAIKTMDDNYFGSYSSFGIHREMLSDKVRTDAYRDDAILGNPSLLSGATVLDVGCGTGTLSLFAAKAGASRVVAVDGSAKMASVATQLGAGLGKGGTSLPFWENVYGFNMLCIGKEVTSTSARFPVVDVLASQDIVTETAVLHSFDLASMKESEMDFTASFELRLSESSATVPGVTWCYGIVLWFDTGFTNRFCKEKPVVLSTSPFSTPTHWSQTIFTFEEPIAMAKEESTLGSSASAGTDECPATMLGCRISIVRASEHRSIDISVETTAISKMMIVRITDWKAVSGMVGV